MDSGRFLETVGRLFGWCWWHLGVLLEALGLGCSVLSWAVLGCPGLFWAILGFHVLGFIYCCERVIEAASPVSDDTSTDISTWGDTKKQKMAAVISTRDHFFSKFDTGPL